MGWKAWLAGAAAVAAGVAIYKNKDQIGDAIGDISHGVCDAMGSIGDKADSSISEMLEKIGGRVDPLNDDSWSLRDMQNTDYNI